MTNIYDITVTTIDHRTIRLEEYRGRVLVIVNVASRCTLTKQYAGLEALQQKYHSRGFDVLGFPCNQFGGQEPDDEAGIQQFCTRNYGVSFPMFAKIEVNGPNAHPLYRYLKAERRGFMWTSGIKWNFTKFLVGRDGAVLGRYGPGVGPSRLGSAIEAALGE